MKKLLVFLSLIFTATLSFGACTSDQIDIAGDGTNCVDTKFSLTTSSTDSFKFNMSASGTFYIDCGNGGILTSTADDVSDKTVVRNNTDNATYTCTWQSSDIQTIRFAGLATGYNTSSGCIVFGTRTPNNSVLRPDLITSISGSLGEIFKSYSRDKTRFPHFLQLFTYAVNLTSLPDNLFSGVWVSEFNFAFEHTGLIEIPENLFSDLSGQPINGAFSNVFGGCRNLQNIPENLFKSVPYLSYGLFSGAFNGCWSLRTVPSGLFSHIKDSTSATVNGNAFYATFYECYGLTSLPEDLFANITRAEGGLFQNTFQSCSHITGYIPPSMFRGLIESGSGARSAVWTDAFSSTKLDTTCPSGTTQYTTGFEDYWGGRVSCIEDAAHVCSAGEYLPKLYNSCAICPAGKYCTGGTYSFSTSADQGITGDVTAGYFCSGGCTTATPTSSSDCLTGNSCGVCTGNGSDGRPLYTDSTGGAAQCSECPAVADQTLANRVISYSYYPTNGPHASGIGRCLAYFTDSDDNATYDTFCYHRASDYGAANSDCIATGPSACAAGKYNTIASTSEWNGHHASCWGIDCMKGKVCTAASAGYYSPEGATTQTQCPVTYPNSAAGTGSINNCYLTTDAGKYVAEANANQTTCAENGYCAGGVNINYGSTGGRTACPLTAPYAGAGMTKAGQCGRKLHIGNDVVYLRSEKATTPSLNVRWDGRTYYGNMVETETNMSSAANHKLKIQYKDNNKLYYVCDDTICAQ